MGASNLWLVFNLLETKNKLVLTIVNNEHFKNKYVSTNGSVNGGIHCECPSTWKRGIF